MKPYGRLHNVKFPSKTDCHPPKGYVNWWEVAFSKEVSRGGINHRTKQEIAEEYYQQTDFAMDDYENIDTTIPKCDCMFYSTECDWDKYIVGRL